MRRTENKIEEEKKTLNNCPLINGCRFEWECYNVLIYNERVDEYLFNFNMMVVSN